LKALGIPADVRIHAENARPEINRALQYSNFKIIPTIKGPDSILAGLDRLRTVPIKIHRSSHNLQMEMEAYSWAKNAQGQYLDKPEDKNNHLIDAARYWALAELNPLRKPRLGKARSRTAKTSMKTWR
jgi:phage terminase large subunit